MGIPAGDMGIRPPKLDGRDREMHRPSFSSRLIHAAGVVAVPVASVVVVLVLWQLIAGAVHVNPVLLPLPSVIFRTMWHDHSLLASYTWTTLKEILLGFALAVAVGAPLGALIVFNRFFYRAFYPLIVASQMVPKVAVAPLFVVWVGTGLSSKVLVAFLISFFPIVVSTTVGFMAVDPDQVTLFRSMGASRSRTFFTLRVPVALPSVFGGLKVAMSLAVVGAIVGEFVAANSGLGYYLLVANGQVDTPGVFAALFVLTLLGVVLYYCVELAERLLVPKALLNRSLGAAATM